MPRNNVYVYHRSYKEKSILVLMNGVSTPSDLDLTHYKEVIGNTTNGVDVLTGNKVDLKGTLRLLPKQVLLLEL